MPREGLIPGTPLEWLARAEGDLALARVPLPPGGYYEDLCFHTQQAAEKALKAVYVHNGWAFRYVHDIEELITGLKQNALAVPVEIEDSMELTTYAWETRYPGVSEAVTEEEYHRAVALAEAVVRWARGMIEGAAG